MRRCFDNQCINVLRNDALRKGDRCALLAIGSGIWAGDWIGMGQYPQSWRAFSSRNQRAQRRGGLAAFAAGEDRWFGAFESGGAVASGGRMGGTWTAWVPGVRAQRLVGRRSADWDRRWAQAQA